MASDILPASIIKNTLMLEVLATAYNARENIVLAKHNCISNEQRSQKDISIVIFLKL